MTTPAALALRARQLGKDLLYLATGIPLGTVYVTLLTTGVALGLSLGVMWVGLPLLLLVTVFVWHGAALERELANRLADAHISPLPRPPSASLTRPIEGLRRRGGDRALWRAVALLALRLPTGVAGTVVVGTLGYVTVALVIEGARAIFGTETGYVGPLALSPGLGVVLWVLAGLVAVLTVALTEYAARAQRWLTRALLLRSLPAGAPVQEALAESLGDRTLSIAYWLADRNVFVDDQGRQVPMPRPGSGRAWTAVDFEGRRVAAIIHDVSLEASPELVQAAAAAASLALANERLKADLRARVEELRASRVRIVEASNAARRRLERDIHDGAQQQLVAMAVELRLLRNRIVEAPEAGELLDRIEAKLGAALEELRELARGIHPGILTDRGLAPALEALATRAPLPVATEIDLPSRPPASVEAVAYFVVAEGLTNVLKYAQARHAVIRARREHDDVVVEIEDDGVGGADERRGTGLQGLRDRVMALDGEFGVSSPEGAGTRIRARLPCTAAEVVAGPGRG